MKFEVFLRFLVVTDTVPEYIDLQRRKGQSLTLASYVFTSGTPAL